jgi:hypothetical protein
MDGWLILCANVEGGIEVTIDVRGHPSVDNPNTTQTLEYTKDKYNAKIIKRKSLLRSHQQPT